MSAATCVLSAATSSSASASVVSGSSVSSSVGHVHGRCGALYDCRCGVHIGQYHSRWGSQSKGIQGELRMARRETEARQSRERGRIQVQYIGVPTIATVARPPGDCYRSHLVVVPFAAAVSAIEVPVRASLCIASQYTAE